MIRTSSYRNFKSNIFKTVSISGDRGKGERYVGKCYPELAPKLSFWNIWHENIGRVKEEDNNRFYIQEYYRQVLSKLDPEKVYKDLSDSILLCYEDNDEFCHRHIVAAWFELILGKEVKEVALVNGHLVEVNKPEYIKDILEMTIKTSKNMRGFHSLHALYLFETAESFERKADTLEEVGKSADNYRQAACYLRCDADEAESEYLRNYRKNTSRR